MKQITNKNLILTIALLFSIGAMTACTASEKSGGNSSNETASTGMAQNYTATENNQKNAKETQKETPAAKQSKSQNKKLPDCRKYQVADDDRLDFASGKLVKADVDGDGEVDTITPRDYKAEGKDKSDPEVNELHWIAFDVKTSGGKDFKSFFKYNYGNNVADYYVYALVPCNSNSDEKADLLFYTGDDNSAETIILESTGNSFKEVSRKQTNNDDL